MPKSDNGTRSRRRALRHHLVAYGCASLAFFVADSFMAGAQWFHWPVMAWGAVVGVHVLYRKCVNVDEDWAERRAIDVRLKSYDLGHITAIDDHYRKEYSREPSIGSPRR